jgi:hypothetical protein
MKTGVTIYATILCVVAATVVMTPFFSAAAQSGREAQTPQPTPTPQATPPVRSDVKQSFVVDGSAEKYRLVFPTGFYGTVRKGKLHYAGAEASVYDSFIERLNQAGAQGYRLISVKGGFPVALVRQDEAQYEYAWFETTSDPLSIGIGFALKYAEPAKRGFHVIGKFFVSKNCQSMDSSNDMPGMEICKEKSLFLLEREKGVEIPIQFTVAGSIPRWRTSKQQALLQTQIEENLAIGFYPRTLFSKYEILLEQTEKSRPPVNGNKDVRVVTSPFWRDDIEKKTNELAQQGYRLALLNKGIAVMYRPDETATPVSYIWLDTRKKEFEKELTKLQEKGAVYRMTYPINDGTRHKLIFELKPVDDGKRRQYRILKFEFRDMENAAEKKVYTDLDPASKESITRLNGLVKEGFAVRELFVSDENNLLLERPL